MPATTAKQLITLALQRLGVIGAGEAARAEDALYCLTELNQLLDSWNAQRLLLPSIQRLTLPLVAGVDGYAIGPGGDLVVDERPLAIEPGATVRVDGVDQPMTALNQQQYSDIALKDTGSIPYAFYYSPEVPLGTIKLYPVPEGASSATLPVMRQLTSFGDQLDVAVDVSQGYVAGLSWSLADAVMGSYGREMASVALRAAAFRAQLKRRNLDNALSTRPVQQGRLAEFLAG